MCDEIILVSFGIEGNVPPVGKVAALMPVFSALRKRS